MFLCLASCKFKNIKNYFSKIPKDLKKKSPPPKAPFAGSWESAGAADTRYDTAAISSNGQRPRPSAAYYTWGAPYTIYMIATQRKD
jgi:hypothetical protein